MVIDDDKKFEVIEVRSTLTISKAEEEIFEKLFPKKNLKNTMGSSGFLRKKIIKKLRFRWKIELPK